MSPDEGREVTWGRRAAGHSYGAHDEAAFREARRREADEALRVPDADLHKVDEFLSWGYAAAVLCCLVVVGLVMLMV